MIKILNRDLKILRFSEIRLWNASSCLYAVTKFVHWMRNCVKIAQCFVPVFCLFLKVSDKEKKCYIYNVFLHWLIPSFFSVIWKLMWEMGGVCILTNHDDVIKWKHFPRYWPFVRGIHRSPVNSPHKGQWCGALMFSLTCAWINGLVNICEAGDLRRNHAHYVVI